MYRMCSSTLIYFFFFRLCGMFNIRSGFKGGDSCLQLPVFCAARSPTAASLLLSSPTTPSVVEKEAHQPQKPLNLCCICKYALKTVQMRAEPGCQNKSILSSHISSFLARRAGLRTHKHTSVKGKEKKNSWQSSAKLTTHWHILSNLYQNTQWHTHSDSFLDWTLWLMECIQNFFHESSKSCP